MLKGHNPQSIIKTLGSTKTVIYNDINFLTEKSKQYVYDMARGTHVLMYQRAIEGIALALTEAWNKFNDPQVPEKQKLGYLRLTKECNESVMQLTINGPSVMATEDLRRRIEKAGIEIDNNNKPLILSESEQIHNYIRSNPSFKAGNEAPISYPYDDSTSNETLGHEAACPTSDTEVIND
jgi:hypothetical protein